MREQLARLSIEIRVKENSRLRRVPVVRIVRRRLEVPAHLSVIRIERHDRRREEIGARAIDVRDDRLRVPRRDVQEVQVGIVGDGLPRHAAAMLRGLETRPALDAGLRQRNVAHLADDLLGAVERGAVGQA